MARLIWTPRAREELRDIRRQIARDSRQYAGTFVERVDATVQRLEVFPLSGRLVPEDRRGEHREVFVHSYRIIYHVQADIVYIDKVIHGARRLTDLPDQQV